MLPWVCGPTDGAIEPMRVCRRSGPSRDLAARSLPYFYGTIRCMKKTLHVDESLLREAKSACGATTDTETVRLGLEALVRHASYERLRALRRSEPHARRHPAAS